MGNSDENTSVSGTREKTVISIPQSTLVALVIGVMGVAGIGGTQLANTTNRQGSGGLSPDERAAVVQLGESNRQVVDAMAELHRSLKEGDFRPDAYTGTEAAEAHTRLSDRISRAHTRITAMESRLSLIEQTDQAIPIIKRELEALEREFKSHNLDARDHISNIKQNTEFRKEHRAEHRANSDR